MLPETIVLKAQSTVDFTVEAFAVKIGKGNSADNRMMAIAMEEGCVYVTRKQACEFFGLIPKPVTED